MRHKTTKTSNLFAEEFRLDKISGQHDPLLKLNKRIEWEQFRTLLNNALYKEPKGAGGCRPYDYVMMFKVLILQRYYNISDDKTEFAILDRLSFMRFLGLTLSDKVPDAKTIWHFREQLIKTGVIEKLFEMFQLQLKEMGLIANEGNMIDASFVEVPIQGNTKEENEQIKRGEKPQKWEENPHKMAQKDTDAKWTKKNDTDYFGYKDHVTADEESKLIVRYVVTDASVHDSQVVEQLITEQDIGQPLYADSAYSGEPVAQTVSKAGMLNCIHEKGYRNRPLSNEQKENNRIKSKTRARVEHIFGFIENSMNGSYIRTIGIKRATAVIGLMNLTYNMFRFIQLTQV